MYITENQSIGESVLFLLTARNTLAEMVAVSDHENADQMIGFLLEDASDYEIISLLVEGVLPEERYNESREMFLFSRLKEAALMNAGVLSEAMGDSNFYDFMNKVDTVYPHISTQESMLEFFASKDFEIAQAILTEGSSRYLMRSVLEFKWNPFAKKTTGEKAVELGKDAAEKAGEYASKAGEIGKEYAGKAGEAVKKYGGKALEKGQEYAGKAGEAVSKVAGKAGEALGDLSSSQAALGGAAAAALVAFAAAKTYKRFFSKAAKACGGMSGSAKTQCMQQHKVKAKAAQSSKLSQGVSTCAKSKNPAACKAAIQRKVASLKG